MPETEWNDGFRMVEVIGLTGPDERVVCLIGTRPPANKVVRFETYRGDTLVYEENFGIGPGLPMAALLNDLEEGFRKDAAVKGARLEIFEVAPPYGPEHPIHELPGRKAPLLQELAELGIADIRDIPPEFDRLSVLQARVRDAVRSGNRYHDPAIATALANVQFPVHFVDFETFMPALPVFPGTRPYQTIPFQWSGHVLSVDGGVSHREYLHEGRDDPRRRFAEALLDTVGCAGSIVVYSGYEEQCLRELEVALPSQAPRLAQLRTRLFDLHPVIKAHIYDPNFHGSFSIKAVLPALVPHLGYDDLEIGDGLVASLAFEELRDPGTSAERTAELRANLLAYCKRDTEAMLELFRALR